MEPTRATAARAAVVVRPPTSLKAFFLQCVARDEVLFNDLLRCLDPKEARNAQLVISRVPAQFHFIFHSTSSQQAAYEELLAAARETNDDTVFESVEDTAQYQTPDEVTPPPPKCNAKVKSPPITPPPKNNDSAPAQRGSMSARETSGEVIYNHFVAQFGLGAAYQYHEHFIDLICTLRQDPAVANLLLDAAEAKKASDGEKAKLFALAVVAMNDSDLIYEGDIAKLYFDLACAYAVFANKKQEPDACWVLGLRCLPSFKLALSKEPIKAKTYLERAAEHGNVDAHYRLAKMRWHYEFKNENVAKTVTSYLKYASDNGHKRAAFKLGMAYLNGDKDVGIRKNTRAADRYILQSAELNYAKAIDWIISGHHTNFIEQASAKLLRAMSMRLIKQPQPNENFVQLVIDRLTKSINSGHFKSAWHLAQLLLLQPNAKVKNNRGLILKLLQQASDDGHRQATLKLATIYLEGNRTLGIKKDLKLANAYLKPLSRVGDRMACYLQVMIDLVEFGAISELPISTYRNSAAHKAHGPDAILFEQINTGLDSLKMSEWMFWERPDEVHYLACYQSAMLYPTNDPMHLQLLLKARSEHCPQAHYHLGILRAPTDVNDAIGGLTKAYENKNASNDIRRDAGFKLGELWESKIPFWTFYSAQAERDAITFKNKAISFYEASAEMGHDRAQAALDRLQGVRTSGIVHTSNAEEQKQREKSVKQFFSL